MERGETILKAAERELWEETGLHASHGRIIAISDSAPENNYHVQIGVLFEEWQGEPYPREPEKSSALGFFVLDKLPRPLFVSSRPLLQKYKAGALY